MIKLYFKKLLSIIICVLICFVLFFICIAATSSIADLVEEPILKLIISLGPPITIVAIGILVLRIKKKDLKHEYLQETNPTAKTLTDEWKYMTRFSPFLAEALAFATLAFLIPFALIMGTADNLIIKLIMTWLTFSFIAVPYFIIDFGIWMIVHSVWRKSKDAPQE